jgi:hypothetical protein
MINNIGYQLSDIIPATFVMVAFGLMFGFLFTLMKIFIFRDWERKKL